MAANQLSIYRLDESAHGPLREALESVLRRVRCWTLAARAFQRAIGRLAGPHLPLRSQLPGACEMLVRLGDEVTAMEVSPGMSVIRPCAMTVGWPPNRPDVEARVRRPEKTLRQ